jgi:chaperonin GroES
MKIIPLNERLLIKPEEIKTKSKGGILIPEIAQGVQNIGTIVAVGKKVKDYDLTAGTTIIYDKYAGTVITMEEIAYVLINISDILAIIKE